MSPVPVALGLGANLGDREATIRQAMGILSKELLTDAVCSSIIGSKPDDCPPGAPDFLNAAICGSCELSVHELLERCLDIECRLGRSRTRGYHADRCIDIDILLYGDLRIDTPNLQVPHPGISTRLYVLQPLAEIAPAWIVPGTQSTIAALHSRQLG